MTAPTTCSTWPPISISFSTPTTLSIPPNGVPGRAQYLRIADEELFALAGDRGATEVGDNEAYLEKWLALQQRFNEVLPTIPLYSNVYFDFYTSELYGYQPSAYYSWASAILYATYGYEEEPAVDETATAADGETVEIIG